jgi:hypothetical protein
MTINELLDELRALRLDRDKADARFLLRLVDVEKRHMKIITDSGANSFAQWLKSEALVDPGRFESFKAGLKKLDSPSIALDIGSEATIIATKLTNGTPKRDKYVKVVQAWINEHEGTLPSREAAERLIYQVDPREREPRVGVRQDKLDTLLAENAELRTQLRSAQAKIKKLESEIARLRGRQPRA